MDGYNSPILGVIVSSKSLFVKARNIVDKKKEAIKRAGRLVRVALSKAPGEAVLRVCQGGADMADDVPHHGLVDLTRRKRRFS